uniref:mRNA decay factor PAT1 domain-containing protein n=1 Tax=Cuerna arida TaxID=1464854 RepID=A0A1B6FN01_9HEMI
MSRRIFDFDQSSTNHETSFNEEEDDTDYDALNSETFGEDIPSTDWEEDHAKLAASEQMLKNNFDEVGSIGQRMASYILDDEIDEPVAPPCMTSSPKETQGVWPAWTNGKEGSKVAVHGESNAISPIPKQPWLDANMKNSQESPNHVNSAPLPPKPANFLTLEELEKHMKKAVTDVMNARSSNQPRTNNRGHSIARGDGDRNSHTPIPLMKEQSANGNYPRTRHGNPSNIMNQRHYHHPNNMSRGFPRGHHQAPPFQYPGYPEVGASPLRIPNHVQGPSGLVRHIMQRGSHHQGQHHHQGGPNRHQGPPHQGNIFLRHIQDPHYVPPRRPAMGAEHASYTSLFDYQIPSRHGSSGPQKGPSNAHQGANIRQHGAFSPHQGVTGPHRGASGPQPQVDEYTGLMTLQEKLWLANIQLIQLNSSDPYQDDYYNTMYSQRQQGNAGRKYGNHNSKNNKEVTATKPASTYTPLQFENSLGKLQIGSVTAPRKIIETELVENVENNSKHSDKKHKQNLMEVEELCGTVLKMEDAYNPGAPKVQELDLVALQQTIMTTLLTEGKLMNYMSIRKGKRAVLRLLTHLFNPGPLIQKLLDDLVPITRKDQEQLLLSFLPSIRIYLATVPFATLVELTKRYDTTFLLSNKFTVSVMANMVERAGQLIFTDSEDEPVIKDWCDFLVRLVESSNMWTMPERPVVAVDRAVLLLQLRLIKSRVTKEDTDKLLQALGKPIETPVASASTASSDTLPGPTSAPGQQ